MLSAAEAVAAYGDNPSAFLALNSGNAYYSGTSTAGVIAYRRAGRYLIQFAGPFAPPPDYERLLRGFVAFAAAQRRAVVAIQLQRDDARIYSEHGFTVNQIGASYAVELARFSLRGGHFVRLRNKVSRARRCGLEVTETSPAACEPLLAGVDRDWLQGKGRHARQLRFLVGERFGALQERRRLFAGYIDGALTAYITYTPVPGKRAGWLHDLSRRRRDTPPGVMEAINLTAIERFREEGAPWLHFGFTPFTGLDPGNEMPSRSRAVARLVNLLAHRGEFVYPSRTQLAYKQKWQPHLVLPEYLAFHGRPRATAVWQLLRTANVI